MKLAYSEILTAQEEIKVIIDSIASYISNKSLYTRLNLIIHSGLQLLQNIDHVTSCSAFIMTEADFDFHFKMCLPVLFKKYHEQIYEECLNSGKVGIVLSSQSFKNFEYESEGTSSSSLIIAPIKISIGIIGMIMVAHNIPNNSEYNLKLNLIELHIEIISSLIENYFNIQELGNSNILLEQKVAARTLDLSQSQRETKSILESVHTGILVYDFETKKIIRTNPVASNLIGLDEKELLRTNISNFLSLYSLNFNDDNEKSNQAYESTLMTASGNTIPILRTSSRINIGIRTFGIESFNDIIQLKSVEQVLKNTNEILELKVLERTEDLQIIVQQLKKEISDRKHAEDEVRKMLAREKELNLMKSKFVSMISHEFRTPLTVIRSSAQMIEKFGEMLDSNERKSYLSKIINIVDYMNELIENVIFIGKDDKSNFRINFDDTNIVNLSEEIIHDVVLTVDKEKDVVFNHDIEGELIRIDQRLYRIILSNILSNAIKYSEKSKPVFVTVNLLNKSLILTVQDFGIGIPNEQKDKIFEMFFRADNTGSISGTGLGLTVVLESIQKMGGTIDITSALNEGSTFIISIPVGKE